MEKDQTCVEFGKWVRDARERRGLHQKDVAEHLGCGQSHYARMERGERQPSFIQALHICEFLNIHFDDFVRLYRWRHPR